MRKQKKQLTVLSVIFAVLLAVNLFLWQMAAGKQEPDIQAEQLDITVTDISVADIAGAAVRNKTGSYGMIAENGVLTMLDAPEAEWSAQKMNAFIYYFSHLKAGKAVKAEGALTEYGLEPADSVITLLLTNGDKIRLSLGKANAMDGSYYFQKEGDSNLYLVEALAAALAGQSMDDFRDMKLFPALDENTAAKLTHISVNRGGVGYVLERSGEKGIAFKMSHPVEAELNWELADKHVIAPLQSLVPETFVSSDRPLADYGLDKPEAVLELTIGGQDYRIGFSEAGGGSFYCAELSGQTVYEVLAEQAAFMETPYNILLGDSVYTRGIAEISNLTLTADTNRYSLDVTGEGEKLTGNLNGKPFHYLEMVKFYKNISQIPIAGEVSEEETIDSKALMTLTLRLRDGGTDVLEFLPVSDRQCAVSVNGRIQFTTYRSVAEDILTAFRQEDQ